MRDKQRQTLKLELLSQWKLEAEFRKNRKKEKKRELTASIFLAHRILPSNIDLLAAGSPPLLPPCCHWPAKHLCTRAFHKILGTHLVDPSFTSFEIQIYPHCQEEGIPPGGMYWVIHPRWPRDLLRSERYPKRCRNTEEYCFSIIPFIINPSPGMYQEIHPYSIDSWWCRIHGSFSKQNTAK